MQEWVQPAITTSVRILVEVFPVDGPHGREWKTVAYPLEGVLPDPVRITPPVPDLNEFTIPVRPPWIR